MIDMHYEDLIPVREVPAALPLQPGGRRIHLATVYRWMSRGVRGVRLEWIRIGGHTFTSREALVRFVEATSTIGGSADAEKANRRGAQVNGA